MILKLIKQHNMKAWEVANILQVHISQIYKWDKTGITINNPHADKLKELFPELELLPEKKRSNAGRPRKQLTLTESDIPTPPEEKQRPTEYPRITFEKRTKHNK